MQGLKGRRLNKKRAQSDRSSKKNRPARRVRRTACVAARVERKRKEKMRKWVARARYGSMMKRGECEWECGIHKCMNRGQNLRE